MPKNRFYKTSYHGGVGSNVAFWGVRGESYVTDIDKAEEYTLEEVLKQIKDRDFRSYDEFPISADHVDALSVWKVDMQHVPYFSKPTEKDPNNQYLLVKKGCYDGNDLYFIDDKDHLSSSTDYSKALTFSLEEAKDIIFEKHNHLWALPRYMADEVARRTFQTKNINRRKMVSGAGAVGIRKPRKRKPVSGKSCLNCPECGKFNWQYNPYELETCKFCGHEGGY